MCRHPTNINPISLKDWTLCLHMGPDGDYLLWTHLLPGWKVYFCCLVTLDPPLLSLLFYEAPHVQKIWHTFIFKWNHGSRISVNRETYRFRTIWTKLNWRNRWTITICYIPLIRRTKKTSDDHHTALYLSAASWFITVFQSCSRVSCVHWSTARLWPEADTLKHLGGSTWYSHD